MYPLAVLVAMRQKKTNRLSTGNGIQKAFYDDPNVLYISLHVYADGKFYPQGKEGDWDQVGEGAGLGKCVLPFSISISQLFIFYRIYIYLNISFFATRNINIPWPSQGMGDGDYMFAFQQVVMPIATEFDPDLVIGKMSRLFVCLLFFVPPLNSFIIPKSEWLTGKISRLGI